MKKILLCLFLTCSTVLFAQLPTSLLVPTTENLIYDEYDGSIYISSRFKDASVIHEESNTYDAKLRYNIYTDALEFQTKLGVLHELKKSKTTHARIDDDYFYYCDFKNQRGIERNGYYILVELTDTYRIYKKFNVDIKDPNENGAYSSGVKEKGFIKTSVSYYVEEAGMIMELPLNKKEMLAVFSDKEGELKKYIKSAKIRLKKEEDLIRFVARYNALKSDENMQNRSLLSNTTRRN